MSCDPSLISGNVHEELPKRVLRKFARQSQLDFELNLFGGILERTPGYVEVAMVHSSNLTARGRYRESLDICQRLVRLSPEDPFAFYGLACNFSMLDMLDPALDALRQALARGYSDFEYLYEDPDLDSVRTDPRFVGLVASFAG